MGLATAYHLASADARPEVTLVERDLTLRRSSTMLSDGNVRIQFNLPENVLMSRYAMEVLETFANDLEIDGHRPQVGMRRQGNLFLTTEEGLAAAHSGLAVQWELGCDVRWMDADEIGVSFPPYASPAVAGGTFGPEDGSVDPTGVVDGYRRACRGAGVVVVEGEVTRLFADGSRLGVETASSGSLTAETVVVCAGAWATELLATAGVEIPVVPVMRTVYVVASDVGAGLELPSVFMPSGAYILPEHEGRFLMAWSQPDDPVGFDFTPADRSRFYDLIWPEIVSWLPAFERLEVVGSWAGLYEQNTLDANAIIGEWPTIPGLFQATGFSGHGFQQCHAVGRHLAELILGLEPSLDLARMGPDRVLAAEPLPENAGRII